MCISRPSTRLLVKARALKSGLHPVGAALIIAMSVVMLCASMQQLVDRQDSLLPGAQMYLPATRGKGVAILILDASLDKQNTMYVDALLAQSYAVLKLPLSGVPADSKALLAVASQLSARAGVVNRPPLIAAIGADSSRRAAALLGQAGAVHALVSVDYCPTPEIGDEERGNASGAPWYALQHRDVGCQAAAVERAFASISNAHITWIAPTRQPAQAPDAEFTALLQWLDPGIAGQGRASVTLRGIPLIPTPVVHARRMVVFLSGDGGWAAFDRGTASALVGSGIAVVGWDSLSYFWQPRTPAVLSRDLGRVIEEFTMRWQIDSVIVAGFSFGASNVPFAVSSLPPAIRDRIEKVVMLAPTSTTSFEFRLTQWLGNDSADNVAVAPEIAKLAPLPVWCVRGMDDNEAACPPLVPPSRVVTMPGDHHFNDDYAGLARLIAAPPRKF